MDRERWQSYPVETPHDRLFLALIAIAGKGDEREVTAESHRGRRTLKLRREIAVEEPVGEAATAGSVVARLSFVGVSPDEGERIVENLWALASEFLDGAEAEARGLLATAQSLSAAEPPHGFEYVIDVIHDGMPHRFGIPGARAKGPGEARGAKPAEPKVAPKPAAPAPPLAKTTKLGVEKPKAKKPAKKAAKKVKVKATKKAWKKAAPRRTRPARKRR